jgi:hypothetical protein
MADHCTGMLGEMHPAAETEFRTFAIRDRAVHELYVEIHAAVYGVISFVCT